MSGLFDPATPAGSPLDLLRDYQTDVLERGRGRMRRDGRRGIVQGETGSGKTWVLLAMVWMAVEKGTRVLILNDRRKIVGQIVALLERFGIRTGIIMAGESRDVTAPVVVACRDTLAAWGERGTAVVSPGLILVDEAHKSLGATYQHLLKLFPESFVVGFTATPARGDGKSLSDYWQWLECTVPASRLIADGWLVRPEVYAPLEIAELRARGEPVKGLAGDPVAMWRKHADGLPTIAFSGKVDASLALRDRFRQAGLRAEHVDATSPDDRREELYDAIGSGRLDVLCSVKLLIEGVDIPAAACMVANAKFGSMVEYRQAAGRIMRPAPGKSRAVILDHSGAAGVHGLPGDDIHWSLGDGSVQQRRKRAIEEGREAAPVTCKQCGAVFSGMEQACPACGWRHKFQPKQKPAPFEGNDGTILSRMESLQRDPAKREAAQRFWFVCINAARSKGRTAGAAAGMFSGKFGIPPWAAGVRPMPADSGDWKLPAEIVFPRKGANHAG